MKTATLSMARWSLTGRLSMCANLGRQVHYIGTLSIAGKLMVMVNDFATATLLTLSDALVTMTAAVPGFADDMTSDGTQSRRVKDMATALRLSKPLALR